jgi:hypothetical protein
LVHRLRQQAIATLGTHRLAFVPRAVAEHLVRGRLWQGRRKVRVDLHGVSLFGPGSRRQLIRWEWVESIDVEGSVIVRSSAETITLPAGSFGLEPDALAERLRAARSIVERPDVIESLAGGEGI